MDQPSSSPPPPSNSPPAGPSSSTIAAAIERRRQLHQEEAPGPMESNPNNYMPFDDRHAKRQEFRRLIDPGIMQRNARPFALEALNILLKLAENIVNNPDNPKFHRFKPTNTTIKTYLVDGKGTLEYAIALGFEPQVENFQPFYVFNSNKMTDMKIGAAIIKEIVQKKKDEEEAKIHAREQEKAAHQATVMKIKRNFMDDRLSAANRGQLEREARAAKAAAGPSVPTVRSTPKRRPRKGQEGMPGTGQTLSGQTVEPPAPSDEKEDAGASGSEQEDTDDDDSD